MPSEEDVDLRNGRNGIEGTDFPQFRAEECNHCPCSGKPGPATISALGRSASGLVRLVELRKLAVDLSLRYSLVSYVG